MMVSRRLGERALSAPSSLVNRLRVDSLLRNSVYIMMTTALTAATGYLFWIIAARMYPAEDVGLASALVGVMMLAATLANLGIGPTLIQALPQRSSGQAWSLTLNAVIATGIIASLLTGTVAAVILPVLSPKLAVVGHQAGFTTALIAGVPMLSLAALLDAMFTAERAAGKMLARTAAFAGMRIPLLVTPILLGYLGALAICWAWILAAGCSVVAGALLIPRLRRSYRLETRGILAQMRAMLRTVAGHQLISLGAILPIYLLPVFVVARLSLEQNAYFYTTWQVGSLFFMVSPSVAVALLAEGAHAPTEIFQKARSSVLLIVVLLLAPMVFAGLGGPLILAMFGAKYALTGYPLLLILVASAIPDAITNVYVAALRVRRYLAAAACLNLGMAAMTMTLAWLLLPTLGIEGAGWAWLFAQSAGTLVVVFHVVVYVSRGQAGGAPLLPAGLAARWNALVAARAWRGASAVAQVAHERILLIVDPCSAGESLRIAPYVRMVRRSYPRAAITLLGNEDALRALERMDVIDRAIRSDLYNYRKTPRLVTRMIQAWTWLGLVARVGLGYNRVITFYWGGVFQHALAFVVCRGPRAGYATYTAFLARRLLTSDLGAFRWKEGHPPQHAALLRAAGVEADGAALPALSVSEVDAMAVNLLLQEHLAPEGKPLIVLHPGSDWACQQWLRERWAELGDALAARYAATILFTGAANETAYVRGIQDRMTARSISLTGQTTLTQMSALLARSALCVCVDSAIFELTQAAGIPAVVLAGPSRPDTGLFGSFQPTILRRMEEGLAQRIGACQDSHNANNEPGCWNYECPMSGLREISVADALQAVDETMGRAASQLRVAPVERKTAPAAPAVHPMLVELFSAFSRENIRWLVMRGEDELATPEDDIDLLIDPRDMPRARALLDERRYLSCRTWGRGTHHFYVGYHPDTQTWATLDVVTELTYGPYLNLRTYAAAGALARRRPLGQLSIPEQDDAFWMLFLHCALDKGRFAPHRAARLVELAPAASADGPLARQVALACPAGWDPARLIASVTRGEWTELTRLAPALRAGFRRREPVGSRARSLANRIWQLLEIPMIRLRRPGMSVALLGPDGAGKSYLAAEIRRSFYVPVRSVYMGLWKSGPERPGDNGGPKSAGMWLLRRGLEITGRLPKAWSRYLLAKYHQALGRVVVFDRYVYDALVSANQPGSWLKRGYMWVLGHSCPAPDLVLVLDAPGELMHARKGEDTPEALETQRQGLLALRGQVPHVQVVDVTRDAAEVRADVLTRIWSEYSSRRSANWERELSASARSRALRGVGDAGGNASGGVSTDQHLTRVTSPAPRDVWKRLLAASPDALAFQTPEWLDSVCAVDGLEDASVLYQLAGEREFIVPAARKRVAGIVLSQASMPYSWGFGGVVATDTPTAGDAVFALDRMASNPAFRTTLRPNPLLAALWEQGVNGDIAASPRKAHVLDLEGGYERVWSDRFTTRARRHSRRAEREGVVVEYDATGRFIPLFYNLYLISIDRWAAQTGEPLALARWRAERREPLRKYQTVAERMGAACRVYLATVSGQPAAASIVLLNGANASYWRGAMDKDLAGPTRANFLLHSRAIQDACREGRRFYHMGESGDSVSLSDFKEAFGAVPYHYAEYRHERLPITPAVDRARSFAMHGAQLLSGAINRVRSARAGVQPGPGASADTSEDAR